MIYAIFEDGSRQYMVEEGDVVRVDQREVGAGNQVEFDRVLLFQTGEEARIGQPLVEGAKVVAEVVDHPSVKTYIQKFRRRKNYRRLRGHRQHFTRVRILELVLPGWERPETEEEDQLEQEQLNQEEEYEEDEGDEEGEYEEEEGDEEEEK